MLLAIVIVITLAFSECFFCFGKSTVDAEQRKVLQAFFEDTNGPGWVSSNGWLSERPVSEWYGVTTDSRGYVIGLSLPAKRLRGEWQCLLI